MGSFVKKISQGLSFKRPGLVSGLKWLWKIFVFVLIMDIAYIMIIWPNWNDYAEGAIPKSKFITSYQSSVNTKGNGSMPRLRWDPVSFNRIPQSMIRALVVAEDSRFFSHNGFDVIAFKEVMEYNLSKRRFIFGGSTISQQTVKNLFLSPSRNPLRKWHELVITFGMEKNLSKQRILELYLNVAEFGRGIYGVNAASKYYWARSISNISQKQAIELAATLPAPVNHNPGTRSTFFLNRVRKIQAYF